MLSPAFGRTSATIPLSISAISAVDPQLYEAARVDGAKRLQIMFHVTLPGILPTVIIMLILRFGSIMSVGFEEGQLLYSPPPMGCQASFPPTSTAAVSSMVSSALVPLLTSSILSSISSSLYCQ
ncbi:MAG: ABC transporter permease subunit [Clostridia bacterium]